MVETTVPNTKQDTMLKEQEVTRSDERHIAPPVDIYEEDTRLVVIADLPGATQDNLHIDVEDRVLTIQARVKHETPGNDVYREFEMVNFYRQFELSDKVDLEGITAELKYGVLTLSLPKAEEAKPKKISVTVS